MRYSFKEFTTKQIIEKAQTETILLYKDNRFMGCFSVRGNNCDIKFTEGFNNECLMATIANSSVSITVLFDEIEY